MRGTTFKAAAAVRAAALGLVLSMASVSASAISLGGPLVSGDLTFSGDLQPGIDLSSVTSLTFPTGDFRVDDGTGDMSGLVPGQTGMISDFAFDLSSALTLSVGGFSFTADSLSVQVQTAGFLVLSGTGILSASGFTDNAASFIFTAQSNGNLRNYSAGISAAPVPIPGALVMFGSALAVLGWRRRT